MDAVSEDLESRVARLESAVRRLERLTTGIQIIGPRPDRDWDSLAIGDLSKKLEDLRKQGPGPIINCDGT